ncbi:hypothetical protein Tco_0142869, partial [Tanacetum coccineum]
NKVRPVETSEDYTGQDSCRKLFQQIGAIRGMPIYSAEQHNDKVGQAITPIRLAFSDDTGPVVKQVEQITRRRQTLEDGDLRNPFKEVLRSRSPEG